MKAEHWSWDDGGEGGCDSLDSVNTPAEVENKRKADQILRDMGMQGTYCCTLEGENWSDLMQKYYDHQGWGVYRPPPEEV